MGPLFDHDLLNRMSPEGMAKEKRCGKMLDIWRNELDEQVFLYDISELSSFTKMSPPKIESLIEALNESGKAAKTHISPTSFKTELDLKDVLSIYRETSPDSHKSL